MKILMEGRNQKGEVGFMLTQIEISIKYIEIMNSKNLNFEDFDTQLLFNEVTSGLHYLKKRQKYGDYNLNVVMDKKIIF